MKKRDDTLTKRSHVYSYIQRYESPLEPLLLFSVRGDMGSLEESLGAPEAKYRKSVVRRGDWEQVAEIESPPDTPTTNLTELMPRETATFLEDLKASKELFTVHNLISQNADPKDWTNYESKEIISGVRLTSFTRGDIEGEDNDLVPIEAEATYQNAGRIFPIAFGSKAGTEITKEVVAVCTYPEDWRGDAAKKCIYALTKVDTTAPKLVYSTNGGLTWTAVSLTTIGTDEPSDMKRVGNYLIICSNASESYFYATVDDLTSWTEVGTGFVSSKGPNAIYAPAVGNIWFAGNGGYLYKLAIPGQAVTVVEDGDLTAQNLTAIHGSSDAILAVGASNAAILSVNGGSAFSLLTGPAVATALNCVYVKDKDKLWIGADALYYSEDRGVTWHTIDVGITLLATVDAIIFCDDLEAVGYVSGTTSTPTGVVKRTTDNGASWEASTLTSLASNEAINSLAVGGPNHVVGGGLLSSGGGDGVLEVASI